MSRADRSFFARDTIDVARDLLGQMLVLTGSSGHEIAGRIVETEAYLGAEDAAAHTAGGRRTARVEPMWGEAGTAYVYFVYGMHHCLNVVTVAPGVPEAVLIRALEPARGFATDDPRAMSGPGKLCRAMGITLTLNTEDLVTGSRLRVELTRAPTAREVLVGPRVGLGHRHDAVHWPLRFGLRGSAALSRPRFEAAP